MSTHGWEDDEAYVGPGILRHSPEGQKIVAQVEQQIREREDRRSKEKAEQERERKRLREDAMYAYRTHKAKRDTLTVEKARLQQQLSILTSEWELVNGLCQEAAAKVQNELLAHDVALVGVGVIHSDAHGSLPTMDPPPPYPVSDHSSVKIDPK